MFAFHNWWHRALYHLDRDETDRVLEIYDNVVRPAASDVVLEMLDASALLWRLHLDGADVGGRWNELADAWEGTIEDGYYAFNDVHAMMAFIGAGRDKAADTLLATMERAAGETGTNAMMTRDVGLPLARVIAAFGREDYAAATDLIESVAPGANAFGGSNAQRDVVWRTLVEAAIRAGRGELARELTARRLDAKPESVFNRRNRTRAEAI
jgi:hypothetical protein